jgi:CO/xanthine dehydrogenase Mo-binding subunit
MTKSTPETGIGQPVIRKEDAALVIGHGHFSDDLKRSSRHQQFYRHTFP